MPHPWFLLLLLALPLLAWLKGRRGGQPAFLYSSVGLVKGISGVTRAHSRTILARLRWLGLASTAGLARPQQGGGQTEVRASGVDIVVALDLSTSMMSEDFKIGQPRPVNRLVVARKSSVSSSRSAPATASGWSPSPATPTSWLPPTLDHDFVLDHVERLAIGVVEDGTAIGRA